MGIDKDKRLSTEARHTEERLREKPVQVRTPGNLEETQGLVHELEVHKIELEMQNEELRQARDETHAALEKYTDLYDFAPIGYFILDHDGIIRSVNLTGASILGVERSRLLGRRFGLFLVDEARPVFSEFLGKVITNPDKVACEMALLKEGNPPLLVRIEGIAAASGQECRIALIDINERKRAEEALLKAHGELELRVEERTAEMQAASAKLRDSRLAALNMLEDTASARRQAEETNLELQSEIMERKHAEEALSLAKDEWERTFDSVPDLITILDNQHRILRVNRAMAEKLGKHPKECIGLTCYAAVHGSDGPPPFCPHAMTIGDGKGHEAEVHEDHLGGDFLVSTTPLLDAGGELLATVHVARDITDRKRAEDALRLAHAELELRVAERTEELTSAVNILQEEITDRLKAEEQLLRLNRLHAVLSETSIVIIRATERDSLFRDFCRIAVEHGGFLLSWIGLVDGETGQVNLIASAGATGYLDDIRISVREEPEGLGPTGISIREGSYYICNDFLGDPCTRPWHATGRAHGIRASASIALKQEGAVIGALTLYADTKDFFDRQHVELLLQMGTDLSFALDNFCRETRRREAEDALKSETARRLQAMEELRENERILMQQSRQAAMGEMIGNIAHQWRQPLNVLGLIIQELPLHHELEELTREKLDASVKKATQAIQHMSQTIDDFRNFFRPDKEKVLFKANDIVANTVSLIEGSFWEQHITIETNAQDDIFIYGYPNEYSQVILNILINARDAFIERRADGPRAVIITLSRGNDKQVATIADNAGGIAEEIMEKIFDPYFTTKGPDKGTGVGLFMSKTIIEKNMSGRLSARNSGNGAEFRIEV